MFSQTSKRTYKGGAQKEREKKAKLLSDSAQKCKKIDAFFFTRAVSGEQSVDDNIGSHTNEVVANDSNVFSNDVNKVVSHHEIAPTQILSMNLNQDSLSDKNVRFSQVGPKITSGASIFNDLIIIS